MKRSLWGKHGKVSFTSIHKLLGIQFYLFYLLSTRFPCLCCKGRNVFSYGRNEGNGEGVTGTARPEVLDKLLASTERIVQEIDSVCPYFYFAKSLNVFLHHFIYRFALIFPSIFFRLG